MCEENFRSLFFQGHYLIDRIEVPEKTTEKLGSMFNKFNLTVLDYVVYITDKLDAAFQSNYSQCIC